MRGITKQRKQQAKFGDIWWTTRRWRVCCRYFHTGLNMEVIEYEQWLT